MKAMWRVWRLALGVATVLGLSSVAFVYFGMKAAGKPRVEAEDLDEAMKQWSGSGRFHG